MNSTQIHLALTHVPVVLSFVGLVILLIALFKKNSGLTKTALYIFLAAGVFVVPVYLTGEGTEEAIEHLPGVSESIIHEHEEFAKIGFALLLNLSFTSLTGLIFFGRKPLITIVRFIVLVLAIGCAGVMAQTAHLGGQVRHSEIRANASFNATNGDQDD